MRFRLCLSLAGLVALAACGTGTPPQGALNGTWNTPQISTIGGIELQLTSSGTSVTGTGSTVDSQQNVLASYTVKGSYQSSVISLSLSYSSGGTGKFKGNLVGSNTIQGTWTPPAPDTAAIITLLRSSG